jgi:hypothetical protein
MKCPDWISPVAAGSAKRQAAAQRLASLALDVQELLDLFGYLHLPAHLQEASKPFHDLAFAIVDGAPQPSLQLVACLTHLVQAKDAAVRAQLVPALPGKAAPRDDEPSTQRA